MDQPGADDTQRAASEAMRALVGRLHPELKAAGFRKRRHTFNRAVDAGSLVHVVNVQLGAYDPPGTVEIPGLRPNLYGLFILNLGVYAVMSDAVPRAFVNEYDCQIRTRAGALSPDGQETWWSLDVPTDALATELAAVLRERALPWLGLHPTWAATLARLESSPDPLDYLGFTGPPRLTAMAMRLSRGEHEAAERDFREHVLAARAGDAPAGHLRYLAELAGTHGFEVP